jgi:serine/threonine-protein kinase
MNVPEQISKYKIARVLGSGSMGVVYEGFDPDIQRRVAIKTLTPTIHDQSLVTEYHTRFRIEAQASARCMHPNIVTILEYGDLNGMPFMVMEFIDGQPLDEILKLNAPLRFNRAIRIFSQILKGLHFAHQSGVVHRDIKPSNIMVTEQDEVKITDFGIARLPVSSEVTQVGYTVGTPHYMAPEQEASSDVDGRADLFALTVILMELLAKVPVTSAIPQQSLSPKGIYITPRVDMNQLGPEPFLSVLQQGLALNREQRFDNAQQYASALKQAVEQLKRLTEPAGQPVSEVMPSQATAIQQSQQRRQQLKEMEQMLVNYIGPVGASLIEVYQPQASSLKALAEQLGAEIPSARDRDNFLRAWRYDDELTQIPKVITGRVQTSIKPVDPNATVVMPSSPNNRATQQIQAAARTLQLDRNEIRQMEELFAHYVGPMAEFLLQESLSAACDFDELVEKLSSSIPNAKEQTDFKLKVRKIAR